MATEVDKGRVLSDVHVTGITEGNRQERGSFTRFVVNYQADESRPEGNKVREKDRQTDIDVTLTDVMTDEDGDLILTRKQKTKNVITIAHAMQTSLQDVGMQVWMGCLLLCNFILSNHQRFESSTVLELGGGTGLASIVMATTARFVICTDIGKDVLEMCQSNIQANTHIYNRRCHEAEPDKHVIVRELDWTDSVLKTDESIPFSWSQNDLKHLADVDVIIAADVIYSNDLTDAFFMKLQDLMKTGKQKTCFFATERRLNFTLSDLEVTCKEYDHFREWLQRLEATSDYLIKQLDSEIPHFIHCPQSRYLELWEIQSISL
ncbi:methyltransferase-like protein 22 [Strongylocentrotus purpuratus]|uniref:Methyltransferase-like protein 22 n=1 Tax=Strongylocentrotus purpuratus TaxID=7668 RepID=A0A7M7GQ05_STRPU|nr:methyltransferase-like protein 22 [Strongylocentrotus purpuratus]|eukprot:XP_003726988.2 PREDICTED: methyltransferase-like protein 22 [Strongylocentrotus purpuratus]